jgi:hypothetical protein
MSLQDIDRAERESGLRGWFAPRVDLSSIVTPNLATTSGFSYGDVFWSIDFHEDIRAAIHAARDLPLPDNFAAIHLRSGDVFYGEYRKFVHYTYKGVTLPVAKGMIEHLKAAGLGIVIFGQDGDVLEYLKREYGATLAADVIPASCTTDTQRAMFEIVLMSRGQRIIAGSSGFAKIAGWIGGRKVEGPTAFFTADEQSALSRRDLEQNAEKYHPLQTAFAYWYAYFVNRKNMPYQSSVALLEGAHEYDPDNQLYPIVLAALHFRHGHAPRGEQVLESLVSRELAVHEGPNLPCFGVLSAKTLGKHNLDEYFPDYVSMKNVREPMTMMFVAKVLSMQGHKVEAQQLFERCLAAFPARELEKFREP